MSGCLENTQDNTDGRDARDPGGLIGVEQTEIAQKSGVCEYPESLCRDSTNFR